MLAIGGGIGSVGRLSKGSTVPLATWEWLYRHAGFPAHRLAEGAERLILLAAAAAEDDAATAGKGLTIQQDGALLVSQRQLAQNRKHTHFKSNNRTKI